jgi:hypothetical protein
MGFGSRMEMRTSRSQTRGRREHFDGMMQPHEMVGMKGICGRGDTAGYGCGVRGGGGRGGAGSGVWRWGALACLMLVPLMLPAMMLLANAETSRHTPRRGGGGGRGGGGCGGGCCCGAMADAACGETTAKAAPTFTSPPLGRPTIPSGSLLLRLHQEAARGGRPPALLASLRGGGRPRADGCDPPPPPPKDDDLRSMLEHSKIPSQREQREKGGPGGLWGDALEAKLKMVARERVVDMAEEEEARRRAQEDAFEHISREGIEMDDEQVDKGGGDEDAADGRESKRSEAEEEMVARMMAEQGTAAANNRGGGAEDEGEGNSRDSSEDGQPGGEGGIQTRECDDLMWEAAEEVGFLAHNPQLQCVDYCKAARLGRTAIYTLKGVRSDSVLGCIGCRLLKGCEVDSGHSVLDVERGAARGFLDEIWPTLCNAWG